MAIFYRQVHVKFRGKEFSKKIYYKALWGMIQKVDKIMINNEKINN